MSGSPRSGAPPLLLSLAARWTAVAFVSLASIADAQGLLFDSIRTGAGIPPGAPTSQELSERDAYGQTPLVYAVTSGRLDWVYFLLEAGADVNARTSAEWVPLHYAARDATDARMIRALLEWGADDQARNVDGATPLDLARAADNVIAAALLREWASRVFPSFDCRESATVGERIVCSDSTLSQLDLDLDVAFRGALREADASATNRIRAEQRSWLSEREACATLPSQASATACIERSYEARLSALRDAPTSSNLVAAVEADDADRVAFLTAQGAPLDGRTTNGMPVLNHAARHDDDGRIVELLLDAGADLEGRTPGGLTPLMVAAAFNADVRVVMTLIDAGADVHATSTDEAWTALMLAAANQEDPFVVQVLLDAGSTMDARSVEGWTALMYAAAVNPRDDVARLLHAAGSNAYLKNVDGDDAIALAVAADRQTLASVLDDGRGKPREWTWASAKTVVDEALSVAGLDSIECPFDPSNWSTMSCASARRGSDVLHELVSDAVSHYLVDLPVQPPVEPSEPWTIAHDAIGGSFRFTFDEDIVTASFTIDRSTPVDCSDVDFVTFDLRRQIERHPLQWTSASCFETDRNDVYGQSRAAYAAAVGSVDRLARWLELGDDPNEARFDGWTPLMLAAWRGEVDTLVQLVDAGARIGDVDASGKTALHRAVEGDHARAVEALLDRGADPNLRSYDGTVPLALAVSATVAEILLQNHATVSSEAVSTKRAIRLGLDGIVVERILMGDDVDAVDEQGRTLLAQAVSFGRFDLANALLDAGADPNSRTFSGKSILDIAATTSIPADVARRIVSEFTSGDGPLGLVPTFFTAARNDARGVLSALLVHGVEVNVWDVDDGTALHHAIRYGMEDRTVALLLEAGADPDLSDAYGNTPVTVAAQRNRGGAVALLASYGADLGTTTAMGMNAWTIALEEGSDQVVRTLLELGWDVQQSTSTGEPPLATAIRGGSGRTVAVLLERGADVVRPDGRSWVIEVARRGIDELVWAWIDAGASIDTGEDESVLVHAVESLSFDAIEAWIDAGTELDVTSQEGYSLASIAMMRGANVDDLMNLAALGIDLNAHDGFAVRVAAAWDRPDWIRTLVSAGANVNIANAGGWTPLLEAAAMDASSDTLALLVSLGADVSATLASGENVIHLSAIHASDPRVIALLVDAGVEIGGTRRDAWSPLHYALAFNPHIDVAMALVSHGADPLARGPYGETPLDSLRDADHWTNPIAPIEFILWLIVQDADVTQELGLVDVDIDARGTQPFIEIWPYGDTVEWRRVASVVTQRLTSRVEDSWGSDVEEASLVARVWSNVLIVPTRFGGTAYHSVITWVDDVSTSAQGDRDLRAEFERIEPDDLGGAVTIVQVDSSGAPGRILVSDMLAGSSSEFDPLESQDTMLALDVNVGQRLRLAAAQSGIGAGARIRSTGEISFDGLTLTTNATESLTQFDDDSVTWTSEQRAFVAPGTPIPDAFGDGNVSIDLMSKTTFVEDRISRYTGLLDIAFSMNIKLDVDGDSVELSISGEGSGTAWDGNWRDLVDTEKALIASLALDRLIDLWTSGY